ncbi:COG1361 S-layer family protein [Haloquadratum walsbyi]|uniref:NPCBM-associated, NEW3 domain of alpha-galactosidase n=1 Tax=Haloquadratum walsbyi J07HQW2 TaxID=1238425 RepID=U1PRY6_9EURY|nr:NEW3 domain-containing protein [Haloquadratum walsbyi]ERG96542.1 MAG: NPCBM-associated, NEW3 domain of alpha-galactosidase [Haloquadratum walsbyi J07HQW2]
MQDSSSNIWRTGFLMLVIIVSAFVAGSGGVAAEQYNDFSEPELTPTIQQQNVVAAGEMKTFDLTIQNRHTGITSMDRQIGDIAQVVQTHRIQVGSATAITASVDAGDAPLDIRTAQQSLGTIAAGDTREMGLTVEVDQDAQPGVYQIPVDISYGYINSINVDKNDYFINRNTQTVRKHITVRIEKSVRLDVRDVTGADLYKDADGTMTVSVQNTGSEVAQNAKLSIVQSEYFSAKSNAISVGQLEPDETTTAEFQIGVENIDAAGTYSVGFQLAYENENGNPEQSLIRTGSVAISNGPQYELSTEATAMYVDSIGSVAVTVTNTGERTAPNARAELSPIEPFTLVSTSASLGTLAPGESATAEFKLEVSDRAIPQDYPLTLTVVHDDSYGNDVRSDPLSVDVPVSPEKSFTVMNTAAVTAGQTETVQFTIKNTGDGQFQDAVIRLNANSPFETDDDTAYVGTLESGETTTVMYTISADGSAAVKTYSLDASIKYDNTFGDTVVSDIQSAPITIAAGDGGLPVPGAIIAGVVIPIALVAGIVYQTKPLSRFR